MGIYGIMGNVPQTVSWHAKVFWEFLRMDDGPREAGNPGLRSDLVFLGVSSFFFFTLPRMGFLLVTPDLGPMNLDMARRRHYIIRWIWRLVGAKMQSSRT